MKIVEFENVVDQLQIYAGCEDSGKDWECITISAIFLRSLELVELSKNPLSLLDIFGPFGINAGRKATSVSVIMIPGDTHEVFLKYI